MKIKLLAVAVAGILLSGCNDDNGERLNLSVQAYDPAVQNMAAVANCDDGTTENSETDYYGNAKFYELTVQNSPESCSFKFTGGANAVDTSNGKSMKDVIYTIPKGLADLSSNTITASPISTLIAKTLGDAVYDDTTALEVMADLGLDGLFVDAAAVTNYLLNTQAEMTKFEAAVSINSITPFSQLSVATAVLSDVLKANPNATTTAELEALSTATTALATDVLVTYPSYPTNGSEEVFVQYESSVLTDYVEEIEALPPGSSVPTPPPAPIETSKPVDPPKPTPPPTGGTGGNSPS